MKIIANNIRVGDILDYQEKLWVVLKTMHTQPGKGGAYMQVEMKDIDNGIKTNIRFRSSESVEKAFLEQSECQFLCEQGDSIIVMDNASYEQSLVAKKLLGDKVSFLKTGMMIKVSSHDGHPVSVTLPESVELKVIECESTVKGQTAASSYKPAVLENGIRIMVPPFIEIGNMVVVKVETVEYMSRAH